MSWMTGLNEIAKSWYQYLVDKGVNFMWNTKVISKVNDVCEYSGLPSVKSYEN